MEVLCFGIAKDIVGGTTVIVESTDITSVESLRQHLNHHYPKFQDYTAYRIAVNQTFADEHDPITPQDEVAIIPPVSGG